MLMLFGILNINQSLLKESDEEQLNFFMETRLMTHSMVRIFRVAFLMV